MANVIIQRRKQFFVPGNCCFKVYVDGEHITTLTNGEKDQFDLDLGNHSLRVDNNFFTGKELQVSLAPEKDCRLETHANSIFGVLYVVAPLVLMAFSVLRFLHVSMSPIITSIALIPLFSLVLFFAFAYIFKKGVLLKELRY